MSAAGPMTRTVAAFRAYKWSPDIAELAARFFGHCAGARCVVLLNEERGPIDVGPYEAVSHGADFSEFALPERPAGQSPWYNSDYVYCLLRQRLPDHDHYLIVESDVAVNLDVEPMLRAVSGEGIDALVHQMTPVDPRWAHYDASVVQPDPHRCFMFACLFSGRALDAMLAARQRLARHPDFAVRPWPICESFVPSALREAGLRIEEISRFVDSENLRYRPFLRLDDPAASRPGSMAHPVLGPFDLATALLYDADPHEAFVPNTRLHDTLASAPSAVAPALIAAFVRRGEHDGVATLHAVLAAQGIAFPHAADLAYGKPALTSSVSSWSRGHDRALDAAGAVGAVLHADCAFHTDREKNAWWRVDLLDECVIERVEILNRVSQADRLCALAIETTADPDPDGGTWSVRRLHFGREPVSGAADAPLIVSFPEPILARHLRLRRIGDPDYFHLRRVRVFGYDLDGPRTPS